MSNLELLAAAFSAILGVEVVTPEVGAKLGLPKLSIYELFHCTYVMRPIESIDPGEVFEVTVKTLTGARIPIQVSNEFTIAEVKSAVQLKGDIHPKQQRLVFNSKALLDHETIGSVGIPRGGTIFLVVLVRGGGPAYQLDTDQLDPGYDYDFTCTSDDGKRYIRGGFEYRRPYGWRRVALKVLARKEYGDDSWLGPNGIRTDSVSGEWPVSYHGTYMESVKNIYDQGYKPGPRDLYGRGVYSSPSLDMVGKLYAQKFEYGGQTYAVAMQNRVNPNVSDGSLVIIPASRTGVGADYWVSAKQDPDHGVHDVRPYGILLRQV